MEAKKITIEDLDGKKRNSLILLKDNLELVLGPLHLAKLEEVVGGKFNEIKLNSKNEIEIYKENVVISFDISRFLYLLGKPKYSEIAKVSAKNEELPENKFYTFFLNAMDYCLLNGNTRCFLTGEFCRIPVWYLTFNGYLCANGKTENEISLSTDKSILTNEKS